MGLDVSHDCWSGPYGGFALWRNTIAAHIGWDLQPTPHGSTTYVIPNRERYPERRFYGWWGTSGAKPRDALLVLLVHSDCEGYIFPHHCNPLADRLDGIITGDEWVDAATARFAAGLRRAADAREVVRFH